MTWQYLIGELSVQLERLQQAAQPSVAGEIAGLRDQVESRPTSWLADETLMLAERLCWESLSRGDAASFARQAAIAADLRLFGICARPLDEE